MLKVTRRVSSFFLQQVHIYVSRTTQVHSSPSFQTQCFPSYIVSLLDFFTSEEEE